MSRRQSKSIPSPRLSWHAAAPARRPPREVPQLPLVHLRARRFSRLRAR